MLIRLHFNIKMNPLSSTWNPQEGTTGDDGEQLISRRHTGVSSNDSIKGYDGILNASTINRGNIVMRTEELNLARAAVIDFTLCTRVHRFKTERSVWSSRSRVEGIGLQI